MKYSASLASKALQICTDLMSITVIDKKSVILLLIEIETQKKQDLFIEWEEHDNLQNHIRKIEQENIDINLLGNLKDQLVQKHILLQNQVIEHQRILAMLKKQELNVERLKLDELLFQTSQEVLSDVKSDMTVQTLIDEQQTICINAEKLYEKAVTNLFKNEQKMKDLIII
jgi:hypothetical protein